MSSIAASVVDAASSASSTLAHAATESASAAASAASSSSSSSFFSTLLTPLTKTRDLFSSGLSWVSAHKRAVLGGALVTTAIGGYVVYRKVAPMIAGFREELKMMEQLTAQLNPQANPANRNAILVHRLEHNLTVGDVTLRQFLLSLRRDLMSRFDVDEIRARMKKSSKEREAAAQASGVAPPPGRSENDLLLWEEFKIAGFSRTLSSLYIVCLLHAFVKLQVSIVSRYVLVDQQAAQARAEAEAAQKAEQGGNAPGANGAGGPNPQQQQAPSLASFGPPSFLPPLLCEEVNRIYFSLSRHAQSTGAQLLADSIAGIVRQELASQSMVGSLTQQQLVQGILGRIRARVEGEVLGLECKENELGNANIDAGTNSSRNNTSSSAPRSHPEASAAGSSAADTRFTNYAQYMRYLLPDSASLSALITNSTSSLLVPGSPLAQALVSPSGVNVAGAANGTVFPGQEGALQNMCSFRLAEMIAESNAILDSQAFGSTLQVSLQAAFQLVSQQLAPAFPNAALNASHSSAGSSSESATIPFANALVAVIKLFPSLFPDLASFANSPLSNQVASPLFQLLSDLPAVKELCAVVYLPSDSLLNIPPMPVAADQPRPLSTLQQITVNKQFAGATQPVAIPITAGSGISGASSTMTIEEIPSGGAGSQQPRAAAVPVSFQQAVQDVKGLPVFERL